ncbi:MAG TPA: hypothetical protein VKX25_07815 [Bryobacteraceae bacterium]|jgi:hypothetical protein|nr:hypothetical protein [Bryobacteraceae bacterium]
MKHLTEEELIEVYYREPAEQAARHAEECAECARRLAELRSMLDAFREVAVPERAESYGTEVWSQLAPRLERPRQRMRFWLLAPALAAMLAIAFGAGVWLEHDRAAARERTRERVLLMAMSDHLERSEIMLTELLHADPASFDIAGERERARDLLSENRLLRQSALQLGNRPQAAVLDDLERVLVSLANAPENRSADETKMLQERVEDGRLLWKVRITSTNARERGQKL